MNKFCHNCGKQLPVVAGMKGCPYCMTPLFSLSSKPPVAAASSPPPAPSFSPFSPQDDDDEYIDHIDHLKVNITKLDVDIRTFQQPKETVGTVMTQQADETPDTRPSPNLSQEQVLQEFQKEAGTLRKTS